MRRYIIFLLVLLFLTGCSGQKTEVPETESPVIEEPAPVPEETEEIEEPEEPEKVAAHYRIIHGEKQRYEMTVKPLEASYCTCRL